MPEETVDGGNTIPSGGGQEPPVSDSAEIARWRQRALELEQQLAEARAGLEQAQLSLAEAQKALGASEQRRQIERQLESAGAIDLETGTLLVEQAMGAMKEPSVAGALAQVRRNKPWLFRPRAEASAALGAPAASGEADRSAAEAAATGDRRALLRYLRARRSV